MPSKYLQRADAAGAVVLLTQHFSCLLIGSGATIKETNVGHFFKIPFKLNILSVSILKKKLIHLQEFKL